MRFFLFSLIIIMTMAVMGCNSEQEKRTENMAARPGLTELLTYMTGSFSTEDQPRIDSSFYDIRLRMVPIWPGRDDGYWLYVEQAVAISLEQPYRQRVYHLTQINDTTFHSDVYTFDDPLRFAGVWKENQPLAGLTPDSLTEKAGCTMVLYSHWDGTFFGSTVGSDCQSQLGGASYATSEVRIRPGYIHSWDRGFDSDGNQVWGARTSEYIFKKIE